MIQKKNILQVIIIKTCGKKKEGRISCEHTSMYEDNASLHI